MATTEDNKKKPLVTLDAANPADAGQQVQDFAKPDTQVGAGWAGSQWSPSNEAPLRDDTPTLTEPQVDNLKHTPTGVSTSNINKAPGGSAPSISQSAISHGVLAGAPSEVVIQHMLDAERKPRTPEEQAALEKKRKRNALFAAIGDGVSALSNLYFTTKGSPSFDQSKSLSKAVYDKAKEEDKEYESAMDRRIRLLKEQRAERFRNEELKIKQQLAEAEKAAKEAKTANDRKKAEDMMKYYTKRNQILEAEKKAAEKRAQEEAAQKKKESEERIKARNSRVASQNDKERKQGDAALQNAATNAKKGKVYAAGVASQDKWRGFNAVENKRHHQAQERNSRKNKNKSGGSRYTGPTYSATYDPNTGKLKGYTVRGRGTTPPTKTGGKISTGVTWEKKK